MGSRIGNVSVKKVFARFLLVCSGVIMFLLINCPAIYPLIDAKPITLGVEVKDELLAIGDVRYYKLSVSGTETLMVFFRGEYYSYYEVKVRQGTLDGKEVVGEIRADGPDLSVEISPPTPGNYYIEVRNAYAGSREFTLLADRRPLEILTQGQEVKDISLWGIGDVRYYKLSVSGTETLMVFFRGEYYSYYEVKVRQGALDGKEVGEIRAYGPDLSVEISPPTPGNYYIEVRNAYAGSREFTLLADRRPLEILTPGKEVKDVFLWGMGDFRYYRLCVSGSERLMVFFRGEYYSYYEVKAHQGSLDGKEVGEIRADGPELTIEIPSPVSGYYFIEVRNAYAGSRTFTLQASFAPGVCPDGKVFLTIEASRSSLPADGVSTAEITTTVKDSSGKPLSGLTTVVMEACLVYSISTSVEAPTTIDTSGCKTLQPVWVEGNGKYTVTYTADLICKDDIGTPWVIINGFVQDRQHDPARTAILLEPITCGCKELDIAEVTAMPKSKAIVPIYIDDAKGIACFDFLVGYDKSILTEVINVEFTGLPSEWNVAWNDKSGEVAISCASDKGILSGKGVFITISFSTGEAQSGAEAYIKFKEARLCNENLENVCVETKDGKVVIIRCFKGDVNEDSFIRANDAILCLQCAVGKVNLSSSQQCAADVTCDRRVRSDDAACILRYIVGKEPFCKCIAKPCDQCPEECKCILPITEDTAVQAPSREPLDTRKPINVVIGEMYGKVGDCVALPLKVDDTKILSGGYIQVIYDSTVLRAIDVSSGSDVLLESNVAEPGLVRIAFARTGELNSATLFGIRFDVLTDGVSPLILSNVQLYGHNALPLNLNTKDGKFASWSSIVNHSALLQNFPNPFNPDTWIPYQLKEAADVKIRIYTETGKLVRTLVLGHKYPGVYTDVKDAAYWDGKNEAGERVSSGTYFYTMTAGNLVDVKKMVIAK